MSSGKREEMSEGDKKQEEKNRNPIQTDPQWSFIKKTSGSADAKRGKK